MENEVEELEEELVDEKEVEEVEDKSASTSTESNEFKSIVIKEMTRIIETYRVMMFANDVDAPLIEGMNKKTDINNVINHIMNNLVEKRIYGGADEITYEYIHEYYVDNYDVVEDNWSKRIRTGGIGASEPGPKQKAKSEAKSKITEEQKQKFYEEALEEAKRAAKLKAEEDFRKAEAKRKEKEKKLAEKKKAEELAKKEAEKIAKEKANEEALKNGAAKQMSLFDLV